MYECDYTCNDAVRNNQVGDANSRCCAAYGFLRIHSCYGLYGDLPNHAACYKPVNG